MHSVACKARSDDVKRLKDKSFELFGLGEDVKRKSKRGFKNVETGRLLCPVTMLKKFDADPEKYALHLRLVQR